MMAKPAHTNTQRNLSLLLTRGGIILMLCCYLATFVKSPSGAPHHHHGVVHQHDTCQKDACHIAIYHPGSKGACHHKFHFTSAGEDCRYCETILPRQIVAHPVLIEVELVEMTNRTSHDVQSFSIPESDLPSDRGPPVMM
jgi:hypothetical protein